MKYILGLISGLMCLSIFTTSLRADNQPPVPMTMIDLGFTDFRVGYAKAFHTWAYGGPLEHDDVFAKRVEASGHLWAGMGQFLNYDNVNARAISPQSTVVDVTARFEHGEVFFRFILYQQYGRASITSVRWAIDPARLDLKP